MYTARITLFVLLSIGSAVGYSLQSTLLVHYARKMDGLSLTFYRNVSFVVTLLPMLFGSSFAEMSAVFSQWPLLVLSSFSGAIGLSIAYLAFRRLEVGIVGSFSAGTMALLTILMGWIFLSDALNARTIVWITIVSAGCVLLGAQKIKNGDTAKVWMGILFAAISASFFVLTKIILANLSRTASPLVSGYFWEISIALAAAVVIILRRLTLGIKMQKVTARQFGIISMCAFPTLFGTACLALATKLGPLAVVNAILTLSLPLSALLGRVLYHEKLSRGQWVSFLIIVVGVIGLKFS